MGVSAAQGSAGLKQGVCTSTTRPSNPYEGQMIYETNTDLTLIWGGTAWQQVSGGTAVGNSGLVYVTSATIGSGVSSVTVSSCFSATYDNYKIVASGGQGSPATELTLKLGSTTTDYFYSYIYTAWNNTVQADGSKVAGAFFYVGSQGTNGIAANIEVNSPFLGKNTRISAVGFGQEVAYAGTVSGALFNTTSYTSFILAPASGTMTGGTIRVYGYRQA